jgi:hypothetical protein
MKRLKVQLVKIASRANIGRLPRAQCVPNKKAKLIDKARRRDEREG